VELVYRWFNLLGQVAVTRESTSAGLFTTAFLNYTLNYGTSPKNVILIYAIVLFLHGS